MIMTTSGIDDSDEEDEEDEDGTVRKAGASRRHRALRRARTARGRPVKETCAVITTDAPYLCDSGAQYLCAAQQMPAAGRTGAGRTLGTDADRPIRATAK